MYGVCRKTKIEARKLRVGGGFFGKYSPGFSVSERDLRRDVLLKAARGFFACRDDAEYVSYCHI